MPRDLVMSRHKGRWQGYDELLPILRISRRNASGNCFTSFILEFYARKSRYHAFAKIQLDLPLAEVVSKLIAKTARVPIAIVFRGIPIPLLVTQTIAQDRKGSPNWGPKLPQPDLVNSPSRTRNNEALNNSSVAADTREPRHECPEGHDDRPGAHHDYKNRTHAHVRARQTIGRGTDRESHNRCLHHREQVQAPRVHSTKAPQPLEEFFLRS